MQRSKFPALSWSFWACQTLLTFRLIAIDDNLKARQSLTLKRPRLADWHEFARLTQGNSLASVLPSAFWAQDGGFNHSDDMQGSGQTCTTHKHQQEVSEKANNKQ